MPVSAPVLQQQQFPINHIPELLNLIRQRSLNPNSPNRRILRLERARSSLALMGIGILIIGVFIIVGGIQMVLVAVMGLAVIGLFVGLSMAVSGLVFRLCDYFEKTRLHLPS